VTDPPGPVHEDELDPDVGLDALTAPHLALLLTAIGVGGALGTVARYEIELHWRTASDYAWSWATFTANLSGAFLLGLLVSLVARHRPTSHYLRPALGTGVLGGWTTFSTYEVETVLRLDHRHAVLGVAYALVTLVVGLLLAAAGLAVGNLGVRR
jgi:CrcB protein